MHNNTLTTWCARATLALLAWGIAASVQASTLYTFAFTDPNPQGDGTVATGSFITDGASLVDPGYDLIVSLTFDYATEPDYTIMTGPFVAFDLPAGAAYNPTTGAFVSHGARGDMDELGFFDTTLADQSDYLQLGPGSFAINGVLDANAHGDWIRQGALSIAAGVDITSTVPEPASLVLLGTGLIGTVASYRRRRTR